jgi:hypothetical protein
MTASDVLISLTVLSKVHVKMVLHRLLPDCGICEPDTTLFTLSSQLIVQKVDDLRSCPRENNISHYNGDDSMASLLGNVGTSQFDLLGKDRLPIGS